MLEFSDSCFNIDILFIKCTREHTGAKSKIILKIIQSINYISIMIKAYTNHQISYFFFLLALYKQNISIGMQKLPLLFHQL